MKSEFPSGEKASDCISSWPLLAAVHAGCPPGPGCPPLDDMKRAACPTAITFRSVGEIAMA